MTQSLLLRVCDAGAGLPFLWTRVVDQLIFLARGAQTRELPAAPAPGGIRWARRSDAWRKVKDVDGTVGWMHHTQLTDKRTVLFVGFTKSDLHATDDPTSKVVAHAQPGVVARLKACKPQVCEVEASGTDGWVDKRNIWGVGVGEVFQ